MTLPDRPVNRDNFFPTARGYKHRRSIRLKDYDHSQNGAYFVTRCTQYPLCRFGEISTR